MSPKNIFKLLLFSTLIFQVIFADDLIDYEKYKINDMETFLWNTKEEKFYFLGNVIEDNYKIIAFSDLNNDKLTDIIAYQKDGNNYSFYSFNYTKKSSDDSGPKFVKHPKELFNLTVPDSSMRNLHIGSLFQGLDDICYLASFNNEGEGKEDNPLKHYIVCNNDKDNNKVLSITSNILILNKDKEGYTRLLFFDSKEGKRRICKLVNNKNNDYCDSDDFNPDECSSGGKGQYNQEDLSLKGGLAYVDLNGDCIPDIVLTHEEGNERIIEIYTSKRGKVDEYCLFQEITLNNTSELGALTITRINDDKNEENAPMLDIIVPNFQDNTVIIIKNKRVIQYDWSKDYCNEKYKNIKSDALFDTSLQIEKLSVDGYKNLRMDKNYPTVIRVGDFLASSNPGIIVKFNAETDNGNTSIISLFKRDEGKFQYYMSIEMDKIKNKIEGDEFEMGLFFDIDETGSLSIIIPTKKTTYFFFNYRRSIFFLKSKLMNSKTNLYDVNLGATYRYIVTNKNGDRHMDISHQLSQTSDTNIPIPYSLIGLDDTNNYVEYFQTISGNNLDNGNEDDQKKIYESQDARDWKTNSPIIPNTQMMISKYFNNDNKIAWNVDLIVQPMEQIWIFLIVVIVVLIIVLIVIIILHFKEVKEEQKETNKFKSWFA